MTDGLEAAQDKRYPRVRGRCPECFGSSLFLGEGGYVTCSRLECADPTRADALLNQGAFSTELTSKSALRAAAQEALRLVNQARSKLFEQDRCEHPDAPDVVAFDEVSSGCERCQQLLWGYQTMSGTVEPADNLNSSLYDAEMALSKALRGAPREPAALSPPPAGPPASA